jgi:hypothetical protein
VVHGHSRRYGQRRYSRLGFPRRRPRLAGLRPALGTQRGPVGVDERWWPALVSSRALANQLYETTEGGSTWTKIKLPAPPGAGRAGLVTIVLPVGTGARLALGGYGTNGTTLVYRSGDHGRTWTPVAAPGRPNVCNLAEKPDAVASDRRAAHPGHRQRRGHVAHRPRRHHPDPHRRVTRSAGDHHVRHPDHRWYVAGGEVETISRTTNGGGTWKAITIPGVNPNRRGGAGDISRAISQPASRAPGDLGPRSGGAATPP